MLVLLIEDNSMTVDFVRAGLADDGLSVDVATDGRQGRERALSGRYDVILLDVMLPDADGFDLVHEFRGAGVETPILMLTAKRGTEHTVRGLEAGADDYLAKPFQMEELKARIRALARRRAPAPTDTISFGGITLDLMAGRADVNGAEMRLTPKEYRLLQHLILNANRVVPRSELLEKVWGMRVAPNSNLLNVNLARLRKKLEQLGAAPRIASSRGMGCMLTLAADE